MVAQRRRRGEGCCPSCSFGFPPLLFLYAAIVRARRFGFRFAPRWVGWTGFETQPGGGGRAVPSPRHRNAFVARERGGRHARKVHGVCLHVAFVFFASCVYSTILPPCFSFCFHFSFAGYQPVSMIARFAAHCTQLQGEVVDGTPPRPPMDTPRRLVAANSARVSGVTDEH